MFLCFIFFYHSSVGYIKSGFFDFLRSLVYNSKFEITELLLVSYARLCRQDSLIFLPNLAELESRDLRRVQEYSDLMLKRSQYTITCTKEDCKTKKILLINRKRKHEELKASKQVFP